MSKAKQKPPQGTLACPVCKHTLDLTIKKRHKTLGIFVPVWGPGPCRNPDCPEYLEEPEFKSPPKH